MRDKVCELVSLTHQRDDTLVSYHTLEYCQLRQRQANHGSALLALD